MGQQTIPILKNKFDDGKTPTGSDFGDIFDSFDHKSSRLPQARILGLTDDLKDKASKTDLANVVSGLNPMGDAQDLQDLETKPKRNNDAYFVLDQLDENGDSYIFRYDAELDQWVNTKQVVYKDVVRQEDLNELAGETKFKFLPDRSFSGYVSIDYNHLVNILSGGGFDAYKESKTYDAGWVQIFKDSGSLEITGCTVRLVAFFNTLEPVAESFISFSSSSYAIPEGAKLCIIDLEKEKNPQGYSNMRVDQIGAGASKLSVDALNSNLLLTRNIYNILDAYIHRNSGLQVPLPTPGVVKCSDFIKLNKIEDLVVRGRNGGGVVCGISFYDENKTFISSIAETTSAESVLTVSLADIPANAYYFRGTANYDSKTADALQGVDFSLAEKVDKKDAFLNENVEPLLDSLGLIDYKDGDTIEGVQVEGYQRNDGTILITSDYVHNNYDVSDRLQYHLKVTRFPQSSPINVVQCFNVGGSVIGSLVPMDTPGVAVDTILTLPAGTVKIAVNWRSNSAPAPSLNVSLSTKINVKEELSSIDGKKIVGSMKIHIYGLETSLGNDLFYIRTSYNKSKTKDILLAYYTNNNGLISPKAAYVGNPSLSDSELMTSTYLVSSHSDSTAPLFNSSVYWHLYAQHGYVIPRISNTVNMTSADVGAKWKDQLNREYTIGDVTSTVIQLLPVILVGEEGKDTRGWKTPNSTAISTLTHVSGGIVTTTFSTTNLSHTQLRPIMKSYNRKFLADSKEITIAGDYYCDEFKVSESQIGYDPAYIQTWYPLPDLSNAKEMARFTWSYNFKGAQCCVNTTIDIRRKVECQSYGATQQQTFFDKDDYKAMFIIPKAAPRNGVELDKPFNSPATSSTGYTFYRNETYLKDVNKPIDRLIGLLHNPNNNTYLVGMAAGLSLVSGDTTTEKRNANIPIATSTDGHQRLGSISPSNTNKFYVAAVNTAPFADDGYNYPNTYFKEINYYLSFFDPEENVGQVFWYKDGSSYVIYAHCQSVQNRIALELPDFMEGLSVKTVEQTDETVLLTSTIQNSNLFVSYNTDDANYIVLKTI